MELKQEYKQTELGSIPDNWQVKRIDQVATVIGGGTPRTSINLFWEGNINWFTPTEVGYDKYLFESKRKLTSDGLKNSSANILQPGTILLTSRAGIGDLGILTIEAATNQGFQSLIANSIISNEFLYYLMLTKKNELLQNASGSTFLEISPSKVKCIKIILPPLPEQTAIATALSNIDELISQTEKLIDKKKAIKQGVMQELLKPKEGWVINKLGNIVSTIKSGGTPLTSRNEYYNGQIPFLSIGDMTSQGKYLNSTASTISNQGLENSSSWLVPKNSLIYSMYASVGFVSINKIDLAISQAVLGMKFKENVSIDFMYYTLLSMQKSVLMFVGEGTQKNLNARTVKGFDIYLPDFKEQVRVAEILSDIDRDIFIIETKLKKLKNQKQGMMQALLTGIIRLL